MTTRLFYRGYTYVELSTCVGRGKYRSRAAIIDGAGSATSSQRFLDFEVYPDLAAAQQRAAVGVRAWIDERLDKARVEELSGLAPL